MGLCRHNMIKCKAITSTGERCSRDAILLGLCINHYERKYGKKA